MRASVLRNGSMVYRDDVPSPTPGEGQVLVKVSACGICGSDLHFAKHGARAIALTKQMSGMPSLTDGVDLGADVFMGHEFAAEVIEAGPRTQAPAPGTAVTSIPILLSTKGLQPIVHSNTTLGGYAEQMLLSAPLLLPIPNGLDPRHAALTEPMAVGLHAVNKSGIQLGTGAIVIGCGPVGIAVIAALHNLGIEPIVASDHSSARRDLAQRMGAHRVVDPKIEPTFHAWSRTGAGAPVIFEAVGVPGILNEVLRDAPHSARVVVVGVCMEPDAITPYFGIAKEVAVQFVLAYEPAEFSETLRRIAHGEIDVAPLVTGEVGLEDVGSAFADLGDPERHCKILVVP
ncbi:dehydrogenase [Mycobacteroides abscessus subsp. massiliense]|uniref:zinc-binding dehydrogenase n=1 Tax=Mycobacteroides abscessus TaxID=36809 RepID=UPI0009A6DEF9|nr:zinc-binding dehydrogenase [Mycobacteroides abscessus]SKR79340.1 dehydrogenase [Mycobacteroides abscessus subsp. massiliense]SKR83063.1 dehydrogenase [Mycobacteroides abscessus subsp. massiliense]SKU04458.1 dehydrogenase [Mycobacteroides abscessus subsp. massiliense]SKU19994.1 dehydrogenase [Mycobacteroides abscessus subsp. massiliense]SKZ98968.1 dehydrogenase [Mycobacteroides abscessus subsp. massiliense]